jgi:purine catabolism regulator
MRARALQLGYDLVRPHIVLWVDLAPHLSSASASHAAISPRGPGPAAAHLADELATTLGAWSHARETHVAVLLPLPRDGDGTETLDALARRSAALLAKALPDQPWSAGLGETATAPREVHRSATEARDAARLGILVLGPCRVARSADLGVYRLLLALRDGGQLTSFVERTLAPLRADRRSGEKLIETLEAYLACNGNASQATERLHLHRNSLAYRLARASALLGRDLDDAETRLALELALRGRRVLEAADG